MNKYISTPKPIIILFLFPLQIYWSSKHFFFWGYYYNLLSGRLQFPKGHLVQR